MLPMIEVHGESFSGQFTWQFRMGTPDVLKLSLGAADFARISQREAFEVIKSALRSARIDWITPTLTDWTFKLEGLQRVIGTRADVPWLTGATTIKPEFSTDYRNASGTYVGSAEFVFYFSSEDLKGEQVSKGVPTRHTVFISYSHSDRKWVDRLRVHLKPLEREGRLDLFDDEKITPGANWRQEIKIALEKAKVAILLISANFLASDFIAENELPPLLAKAESGGATIIPVIVSPSRFTRTPSLERYQTANDPRTPLIGMSEAESEQTLVIVAEAVLKAAERH